MSCATGGRSVQPVQGLVEGGLDLAIQEVTPILAGRVLELRRQRRRSGGHGGLVSPVVAADRYRLLTHDPDEGLVVPGHRTWTTAATAPALPQGGRFEKSLEPKSGRPTGSAGSMSADAPGLASAFRCAVSSCSCVGTQAGERRLLKTPYRPCSASSPAIPMQSHHGTPGRARRTT
jgi:hypothetical protein